MRSQVASPPHHELVALLTSLLEPAQRAAGIHELAARLGVETVIFFIPDRELGKFLAAPGFPQTLPDRETWQRFLSETRARQRYHTTVPWPDAVTSMPAVGLNLGRDGVMALVGGRPDPQLLEELALLAPLIAPGLACERIVSSVGVQLQLAREATQESSALARSLDQARRAAQAEIAARKQAEDALRQVKDELAVANRELEDRVRDRTKELQETIAELEAFSYTVSHDLRAPLRAIYGYAGVLGEEAGPRLDAQQREHLKRIERAAQRLDRMIQDVLRYTRVSRVEIALHVVALEECVRDVIAEHPILKALSDQIEIVTPMETVLGHEVLLAQCISNLLLNAVKFVAPGVQPRVRLRTEPRADFVRLWVEDNGIGIPEQNIGRLFGMFERLLPGATFEGNGIGLAIVKRAVHRLGGEVGVESVPDEGSRFWIDLRRA